MKIYSYLLLLLAVLLLPGVSSAQEKELPPEGGTPKNFKIPAQNKFELDNGLKTIMVDYGLVPKVTIQLYIGAGSILESADKVGLTNLLASLLEEGTATQSAKDLSVAFAKMGGQLNVTPGTHVSTISATVLSEFAPDVVRLFSEVVQQSKLPASELERVKNNFKRQISVSKSQAGTVATQLFDKAIFGDHPYGRELPSDEMIDGITIDEIKAFHQEEFGAKRSTLYVVGKFDQSKVEAAVKANFANWPAARSWRIMPALVLWGVVARI